MMIPTYGRYGIPSHLKITERPPLDSERPFRFNPKEG